MTLCIVQARLGSARLPGKSLMPIGDRPLIAHVMERAAQIQGVRFLVLAVPFADVKAFASISAHWIVMGFRTLADADVLGRFVSVADRYPGCDTVMRVTGDCPLLDPRACERVLACYQQTPNCAYAWNVADGYVDGEDCEVFSAAVLGQAHRAATDPSDREHVTPWIRRSVTVATVPPLVHRPGVKTSVDTIEDLERVRALVAACP